MSIGDPGSNARTLLPSAAALYYTLAFTADGKTPVNETIAVGGSLTKAVDLEPGTWALAVKAYLNGADAANSANAVASGSVASIVVTNGGTTPASVKLAGVTENGAGALNYTISFPDTADTATLFYGLIGAAPAEVDLLAGAPAPAANVITASAAIPSVNAGYYQIVVRLTIGGTTQAGRSEVAHVYKGQTTFIGTTAAPYAFAAGDFYAIPTYTVSGTVYYNDGPADKSVTVQLKKDGAPQGSPVTASASNGGFTISNVPAGAYTIAVSKPGYDSAEFPAFAVNQNVGNKYLTLQRTPLEFNDSNIGNLAATIAAMTTDPIFVKVSVTDATLLEGTWSTNFDPLYALFNAIPNDKYVSYDLSGSTFTSFAAITDTAATSRPTLKRSHLVSITLPNTLTSIADNLFCQATGLKSVTIPGSGTIGQNAFYGATGLESVAIAEGITSIGNSAFYGATGLESITIPASVDTIGTSAFDHSTSLKTVSVLRDTGTLTTAGSYSFSNAHASLRVYVSPSAVASYRSNWSGAGITYPTTTIVGAEPLTAGAWTEGTLNSNAYAYYQFNVTAGKQYAVSIQRRDDQSASSSYTLFDLYSEVFWQDTQAEILPRLRSYDTTEMWYGTPRTFTPTSSGSIIIRIQSNSGITGTYAVLVREYTALTTTFSALTANGDNHAASTQLTLTFTNPVDLLPGDIAVTGDATANGAPASANGTTWTVPITVTGNGAATVTVTRSGVGAPEKSAAVYGVPAIGDISYTTVGAGSSWTLEGDGRYKAPSIGNTWTTSTRVAFTSTVANATLTIVLDVSSENNFDWAFVGLLDDTTAWTAATVKSTLPTANKVSGPLTSGTNTTTTSKTVTITVPTAGSHSIDIGYAKDSSTAVGSDTAWFKIN